MFLIYYEIDPIDPDQPDMIARLWELNLEDCWVVPTLAKVASGR